MTIDLIEVQKANRILADHRQICGKKIIIVEGPAGSGKSTLVKRLDIFPETATIKGSLGKRSFQVFEAGAKSFLNDTTKLMNALLAKESVVFIDRCMASQAVYHAIRTDQNVLDPETLSERTNNLVWSLERDLSWRLNRVPRSIEVYWMFLTPDADALRQRRKNTKKEYPNDAAAESYHYRKLSNGMSVIGDYVLRPQFDDLRDADFIVESFQTYLEYFPYIDFPTLWRCFAGTSRRTQ